MKRVINGVTYNTSTAVKIARSRRDNGRYDLVTMYETRKGAFFFCLHNSDGLAGHLLTDYEDPENFLNYAEEIYIDPSTSSPAKTQQETAIFIRTPVSLKRSVEGAAQDQGVSVNHLVVRCLENCLSKTKP